MRDDEDFSGSSLLTAGLERVSLWLTRGSLDRGPKEPINSQHSHCAVLFGGILADSCAHALRGLLGRRSPDLLASDCVIDVRNLELDLQESLTPLLVHQEMPFCGSVGNAAGLSSGDSMSSPTRSELSDLLISFPALTYVLSARMEAWARSAAAAASGLLKIESPDIQALLGVQSVAEIKRLASSGGDTHDGKEGMIIGFPDGVVVYKPRDLRIDVLVGEFARIAGLSVRVPQTVAAGSFGWAKWESEVAEERSQLEVERLYVSLGHALALSYVFGLRDLHGENVVLGRDSLTLIDLEVAFVYEDGGVSQEAFDLYASHLIPSDHDPPGITSCVSASPAKGCRTRPVTALTRLQEATGSRDSSRYCATVVGAFIRGVSALRAQADSLTALLHRASGFEIRHVLRPTDEYARILAETTPSESLGTVTARMERLNSYFAGTPAAWKPLVRGEIKSLVRGEFPRVATSVDSRSLHCNGYVAHDVLDRRGLDVAAERLSGVEAPGEFRGAIGAIRNSFASRSNC